MQSSIHILLPSFSNLSINVPNQPLSIGVRPGTSARARESDEEEEETQRRGGRRKLTVRTPSSFIEPGDFDPGDDAFAYESLREQLHSHIAIVRAMAQSGESEQEDARIQPPDEEALQAALDDPHEFATELSTTVDHLLLLCAYQVYAHNGVYRNEIKTEDGDVDAELLARWNEGKVGRSRDRRRIHPKNETIDRVNYGRTAMGTMPVSDKEGVTDRIYELLGLLDAFRASGAPGIDPAVMTAAAGELGDALLLFDDDTFDINYWAVNQEKPTPLLTDAEEEEFHSLVQLVQELEQIRYDVSRLGAAALPRELSDRMTNIQNVLLPRQISECVDLRITAILQFIKENEKMQNRYAYRMDAAKRSNKCKRSCAE